MAGGRSEDRRAGGVEGPSAPQGAQCEAAAPGLATPPALLGEFGLESWLLQHLRFVLLHPCDTRTELQG